MNKNFDYIVVQDQRENTRWYVVNDVVLPKSRKRWLELENQKTGQHKEVKIFWLHGSSKYLISEEICEGVSLSDRYLFAKKIGRVLLVEDKSF
ncbi:hypothetical protein [Caproiciproducens sp. CPB-2]|uniref:hypothetical protein n=1 Tax=Caproiciproducens sp. CPB-2 TaxID=3030017 RepID=UPI0023D9FDD0|nr:hypothetical protein [Caproiciproducens sp. CPB-2]MDF1496324.1 hypothetical protein [Caproiciproducens sp. CPB-2]